MREEKRLIKNTGIIAIGNLSTKLITFLLLPLYTSILSTAEYGTVDYIVSIGVFCIPFASFLMDEAVFRFLIDCQSKHEEKEVISNAVFIVLLSSAVLCAIGLPILGWLKYEYWLELMLYVLSFVFSSMLSALFRGYGRTDQYAIFNCLTGVSTVIFNVLFIAVFRMGVRGLMLAYILGQAVLSVVFVLLNRMWRYVDLRLVDRARCRAMARYSLPLIPNRVSWSIINLSDRLIIMNLIGASASGLYAVSYKFPTLMDTVYGFFYQSWKESSARALKDASHDDFYNMVYGYLKDFMYSVVLCMTAFMPLVFHFMVNEAYHEALLYVPILLLGMYFSNISAFYGGIFTAYKDTKIMGTTTAAAAVINLAVNLMLIRQCGLYAAALSTLLANFVVYMYRRARVRKYIDLKEESGRRVLSLLATAAILVLFYLQNTLCSALGCGLALAYALAVNRNLLKIVLRAKRG